MTYEPSESNEQPHSRAGDLRQALRLARLLPEDKSIDISLPAVLCIGAKN